MQSEYGDRDLSILMTCDPFAAERTGMCDAGTYNPYEHGWAREEPNANVNSEPPQQSDLNEKVSKLYSKYK